MSPIANMLIKIKNAEEARHERVLVPFSKMKLAIAQILQQSGFIGEVEKKKKKLIKSEGNFLDIKLPQQVKISGVRMISKPSRRFYIKTEDIKKVKSGYGVSIISTPKGIMTGDQARKAKVGGELICEIW